MSGTSHLPCRCGGKIFTIDSRGIVVNDEATVRRRKKCSVCGERFTTYEARSAPRLKAVLRAASRALRKHADNLDAALAESEPDSDAATSRVV